MRSEEDVREAIQVYSDTVKRICMLNLKNSFDTDDIFQTVFLKYAMQDKVFESESHKKAWIIKVTMNACKDWLKDYFRNHAVALEAVMEQAVEMEDEAKELFAAVLSLPKKNREVVYLHFYEGYTAGEIAAMLGKNVNTVYTLITRSKELLRKKLEQG